MIDFVQKQLEASERLFEMMRDDHNQRMKELEHWAMTTHGLLAKLAERDKTIEILRKKGYSVSPADTNVPENETPEEQTKALEDQIKHLSSQILRLKDENEALRLDLGLKVHGL
jgi:predicted  nucleic acid-binding Zn-ribbon protein